MLTVAKNPAEVFAGISRLIFPFTVEELPDTTLGTFADSGFATLINSDDDSSPSGGGTASGLSGTVNPDGTVNLAVSGYEDLDFDGIDDFTTDPHIEEGDYNLLVLLGTSTFNDIIGDIDFFTFTGLVPGSAFTAGITPTFTISGLDSMLGWLADDGTIIEVDDDSGDGYLSRVSGMVPASGNLHLAVTGWEDDLLEGNHDYVGTYTLTVVPEPISSILFVTGGLALGGIRYLKKEKIIECQATITKNQEKFCDISKGSTWVVSPIYRAHVRQ